MFFKINDTVHMVSINWLFDFKESDIVFTDRNTGEIKHSITCSDDLEQLKLYAFINRTRSEIVRNMKLDASVIEISANKELNISHFDIGDDER